MSNSDVLVVNELFGPTLQGEGPSAGRPAVFLRLGGCNLHCVWCDTPYTWDWTRFNPRDELKPMQVKQVFDEVASRLEQIDRDPILVITGGEPMLQQRGIASLVDRLFRTCHNIEIETAATLLPIDGLYYDEVRFNCSPKLAHSGNPPRRLNPDALKAFADLARDDRACFKFVVQTRDDLVEVDDLVTQYSLWPVYVMAEGITNSELYDRERDLVSAILNRGYRLSPRLHITLFGNQRGV